MNNKQAERWEKKRSQYMTQCTVTMLFSAVLLGAFVSHGNEVNALIGFVLVFIVGMGLSLLFYKSKEKSYQNFLKEKNGIS